MKNQDKITQEYIKTELKLTDYKKPLPMTIVKIFLLTPFPDIQDKGRDIKNLYRKIISIYNREGISNVMDNIIKVNNKQTDKQMINFLSNIHTLLLIYGLSHKQIYILTIQSMIKKLITTNKKGKNNETNRNVSI